MRSGSLSTARRNISGAKLGTPVKVRFSPSLKRVADIDGAVIVQADDIARVGLLGLAAIGGKKSQRIGNAHILVEPHMMQSHAARVASRTQAHERDPVAVPGIHIGLNLEHESGEFGFIRIDGTLQASAAAAAAASARRTRTAVPGRRNY